jgi:hypothetical protein
MATTACAAEIREGGGGQQCINVGSVIFLCVSCPVLSCTTPKGTHRSTWSQCNHNQRCNTEGVPFQSLSWLFTLLQWLLYCLKPLLVCLSNLLLC